MARLLLLFAALAVIALPGCLLSEDDCGLGFVFDGDRCLPADPPPPFREGDGGLTNDGAPLPDREVKPTPEPPLDDWAEFGIALIIDRTPRAATARTPASPGADIDAIQAVEPTPRGDQRIGVGGEVLGALFNDPFDGSLNLDPGAVLGEPDGQFASLGPDGGFVYVELALSRPLRAGDLLVIVERLEPDGGDDGYTVYMCRSPDSIDDCRHMGDGQPGTTRFTLE